MRHIHKESLCEEFNLTDIANTINQLSQEAPSSNVSTQEAGPELSILEYIRKIEGYRIRLREIHWSTAKHAEHVLTDSLIDFLSSHEDAVAEVSMGVLGVRIKVGQVVPIMADESELKPLLQSITNSALEMKKKVEDDIAFSGLTNLLDDCIQELSKGKYLETLT